MAQENKIIAQNVRRQRTARGLTQAELARLAGLHQPQIADLEKGDGDPRISSVARVADALDVPTASLFIPAQVEAAASA